MTDTRIPIVLLTGFLGSGKTTLLNRLIHQPEFAECAVIINEFGAIGLDQALVADRSDDQDIQLLDSGCLCCLSSTYVQTVLISLYYRRLRQKIPYFKRILIETSGFLAASGGNTTSPTRFAHHYWLSSISNQNPAVVYLGHPNGQRLT